jgi:hypothetical protein
LTGSDDSLNAKEWPLPGATVHPWKVRSTFSLLVPNDQVDRIFERVFIIGRLDTPGMGYLYVTPLLQAATYIPPNLADRA